MPLSRNYGASSGFGGYSSYTPGMYTSSYVNSYRSGSSSPASARSSTPIRSFASGALISSIMPEDTLDTRIHKTNSSLPSSVYKYYGRSDHYTPTTYSRIYSTADNKDREVKTIRTSDIDTTKPRETTREYAIPGEITRDTTVCLPRGKAVVRMVTQRQKEHPFRASSPHKNAAEDDKDGYSKLTLGQRLALKHQMVEKPKPPPSPKPAIEDSDDSDWTWETCSTSEDESHLYTKKSDNKSMAAAKSTTAAKSNTTSKSTPATKVKSPEPKRPDRKPKSPELKKTEPKRIPVLNVKSPEPIKAKTPPPVKQNGPVAYTRSKTTNLCSVDDNKSIKPKVDTNVSVNRWLGNINQDSERLEKRKSQNATRIPNFGNVVSSNLKHKETSVELKGRTAQTISPSQSIKSASSVKSVQSRPISWAGNQGTHPPHIISNSLTTAEVAKIPLPSEKSSSSASSTSPKKSAVQRLYTRQYSGAGANMYESSDEEETNKALPSTLSRGWRKGQPPRSDVIVKISENGTPNNAEDHSKATNKLLTKEVPSNASQAVCTISSRVPASMAENYKIPGLFIKSSTKSKPETIQAVQTNSKPTTVEPVRIKSVEPVRIKSIEPVHKKKIEQVKIASKPSSVEAVKSKSVKPVENQNVESKASNLEPVKKKGAEPAWKKCIDPVPTKGKLSTTEPVKLNSKQPNIEHVDNKKLHTLNNNQMPKVPLRNNTEINTTSKHSVQENSGANKIESIAKKEQKELSAAESKLTMINNKESTHSNVKLLENKSGKVITDHDVRSITSNKINANIPNVTNQHIIGTDTKVIDNKKKRKVSKHNVEISNVKHVNKERIEVKPPEVQAVNTETIKVPPKIKPKKHTAKLVDVLVSPVLKILKSDNSYEPAKTERIVIENKQNLKDKPVSTNKPESSLQSSAKNSKTDTEQMKKENKEMPKTNKKTVENEQPQSPQIQTKAFERLPSPLKLMFEWKSDIEKGNPSPSNSSNDSENKPKWYNNKAKDDTNPMQAMKEMKTQAKKHHEVIEKEQKRLLHVSNEAEQPWYDDENEDTKEMMKNKPASIERKGDERLTPEENIAVIKMYGGIQFPGGSIEKTPKNLLFKIHKKPESAESKISPIFESDSPPGSRSSSRLSTYSQSSYSIDSSDEDHIEDSDDDQDDAKWNSVSRQNEPPVKCRPRFKKYAVGEFKFLKVLGKGSFGKVLLAELKETSSYYAIKALKKNVVLEDDDIECTMIERRVLTLGCKHPFLCHLFCTFQTHSHLFFVMEYLNGGDLMFHIQQQGRFDIERARFYSAEILLALKFLHRKGIIYRDLKLDNLLLDYEGHIRIVDFGMCKLQIYLEKAADTFCGTPDYMAPEIIKGLKYTHSVDWWSFGVLLYEMMIGQSPFNGCDEDELFWSICNEQAYFPRFLPKEAKQILQLLLEKDPSRRLGVGDCVHGDVCDQPFFSKINFNKLQKKEIAPPYKPKLRDPLDVSFFDTAFTEELAKLTPVDEHFLSSMNQMQFKGFSFTNPNYTLTSS